MASKKHGLGRGLDALLMGIREKQEMSVPVPEKSPSREKELKKNVTSKVSAETENLAKKEEKTGLLELDIDCLSPGPYQPRQKMDPDELESLSDSIRAQGVLQPLLVKPTEQNRYEIIAGERRFRAAKLAGLKTVPAIIKDVPNEAVMAIALIENIQRQDLNPLEEAQALERLSREFKLTHIQVAEAVGKSRASVTNSLRLLSLTEETKALLDHGKIDAGHAKVLLALKGREQSETAEKVATKGWSVRETERYVAEILEEGSKVENYGSYPKKTEAPMDPDVKRLQDSLSLKLGAKLEIKHHQGKGKLVIQYNSLEELEGILEHIQ